MPWEILEVPKTWKPIADETAKFLLAEQEKVRKELVIKPRSMGVSTIRKVL